MGKQTRYAAANTFMASLAEQRKRRGLAVFIISIGPVFGVGYTTRPGGSLPMTSMVLQRGGFVATSERDLDQLFGEAVLVGRPGSDFNIELVSGVRTISPHEKHPPVWEAWPRMSQFVLGEKKDEDTGISGIQANVPISTQVSNALNDEQIYNIIWDAFTSQLSSHFQLDVQVSRAELRVMGFDQMGIDSLIAAEIRGWFMKILEVNIPVLKILNGGSVGDLVAAATETISSRLVSNSDDRSLIEPSSPRSDIGQQILVVNRIQS